MALDKLTKRQHEGKQHRWAPSRLTVSEAVRDGQARALVQGPLPNSGNRRNTPPAMSSSPQPYPQNGVMQSPRVNSARARATFVAGPGERVAAIREPKMTVRRRLRKPASDAGLAMCAAGHELAIPRSSADAERAMLRQLRTALLLVVLGERCNRGACIVRVKSGPDVAAREGGYCRGMLGMIMGEMNSGLIATPVKPSVENVEHVRRARLLARGVRDLSAWRCCRRSVRRNARPRRAAESRARRPRLCALDRDRW